MDGPASVQILSGKVEVFGKPLIAEQRVVVRKDKRKPFFATETAVLNVLLGANAAITEVEGNTIPQSWNKPVQTVQGLELKPVIIMVLGASDVGKSSFCTYMLNKLMENNRSVAVLDGDLGQSDIGPSATVSYAVAPKPVTELGNLRFQNGFFVGVTSPVNTVAKTIQGLTCMISELNQKQVDYIIINTDGFISGDAALRYKLGLIKELKPNVVVGIQKKDELRTHHVLFRRRRSNNHRTLTSTEFTNSRKTQSNPRNDLRKIPQKIKAPMHPRQPNNRGATQWSA